MAENGGYTYREQMVNPPVSGLLFASTNHVVLNDVVDATGTSTPFIFGAISARSRRARNAKLVMITLPTPVPNMALLSAGDGVLRKAGFALEESQRLPLEGNFDASFSLYCPREYETDALYIFTPDLMARLIDSASGCDIEFVDNRVLIYAPPTAFTTEAGLAGIPDLVSFLEGKLHRQTLRYRDDRREATAIHDPFLRAQVTALGGSDSEFRVALRGRRLRRRTTFVQKVGIGFALLLAAAAASYWVTAVLRAFMP